MASPLDRIRMKAGVEPAVNLASGRDAGASPAPVGLNELLASHRGAAIDLEDLRPAAGIATALGVLTVVAHRFATNWAASLLAGGDLFVYRWVLNILTFWGVDKWAPVVAAISVLAIGGAAIWTRGVSEGHAPAIALLAVGAFTAAAVSIPLLLAALVAVVAVVVYIVAIVVLAGLILFLLFCMIADS